LPGIENPEAESFNSSKIALIIGDYCIASGCHSDFQHVIIMWIRQKRAPEKKYFLVVANFTQEIDKISYVSSGDRRGF
jgi:hypothetical protein